VILGAKRIRNLINKAGDFNIVPFRKENLKGMSYDVTLGNEFAILQNDYIDLELLEKKEISLHYNWFVADKFNLPPNESVLAITDEYISLPEWMAAYLSGKSSLARIGLSVHTTAGWIHAGFRGKIVLEITNVGNATIILSAGAKIAQLIFMPADGAYGYSGKWQDQQSLLQVVKPNG